MKKIIAVLLALLLVASFAACSKSETKEPEAKTPATKLFAQFKKIVAEEKDPEAIVAKLADSEVFGEDLSIITSPVEEGYLNGFSNEIKGFSKGAIFGPAISSIPVIGYIFETDDAAALKEELKKSADLRWNVCTQADEMVCENVDGLVFFMMAPNSFDEPADDAEPELPEIPDELTPDAGAEIPDDADLGISIG